MINMVAQDYVVPEVLRQGTGVVLRQCANSRKPLRRPAADFLAAGLEVPEDRAQWNDWQLTGGNGHDWGPAELAHVASRGGELMPRSRFAAIDIDITASNNPIAWLESSGIDLHEALLVRTPGHGDHLPGLHAWYRLTRPVRFGELPGHHGIELKSHATCPGSPGYKVLSVPPELLPLPGMLSDLAGSPVAPQWPAGPSKGPASAQFSAIVAELKSATCGRTAALLSAASRAGWFVAMGSVSADDATAALLGAAEVNGFRHGPAEARRTVRNGLQLGAGRYQKARAAR